MFSTENMLLKSSTVRVRILVNIWCFLHAWIKGRIICKGGKGIRQEDIHAQDQGCCPAEYWAHAYEKVPYVLVEALSVPFVVDVSQDSVRGLQVKQFEFNYLVLEKVTHQQVAKFMDRGAYPGCSQNSFPAHDSSGIKIGSVFNNAEYYADKDQRACNVEGSEEC